MENDFNLSSNKELEEEQKKLEEIYEAAQKQFAESYKIMMESSEKYVEIQKIIDKRTGKNG